jgi:rhodanese-related sulfurtransferase
VERTQEPVALLGIGDLTVLEWRFGPESGATHPAITSLHVPLILLCHEGYSSSLPVGSLLDLGATDVTDVEGGLEAWRAAGLPVAPIRHTWPVPRRYRH